MDLTNLKPGDTGIIVATGGEGALRRRLLDMGLTPGTQVTVRKVAPFGDPIEIFLRGYELTIRGEDAQNIKIAHRRRCINARKERRRNGATYCACGESELREDDAVQSAYGEQPARRKFSRRYRGKKRGSCSQET